MVHSKYIIILGPDGSGKTTLSDKLAEKIKAEKRSVKRINFSFGIMPPISSVLRRKKHKYLPEGETNSGMVVPLPLVISVLLAIWYGIDHLLGHWRLRYTLNQEIVINTLLVKKNKKTLFH